MNIATPLESVHQDTHLFKTQATEETEPTLGSSTQSFDWSTADDDEDDLHVLPLHLANAKRDIRSHYAVSPDILGSGQFGTVRKCIQRSTGKVFAVKTIRKTYEQIDAIRREVELLQEVNGHPGIISLVDVFEDANDIHIVTELCDGGELYDYLAGHMELREDMVAPLFEEAKAARILNAILESVAYLHDRNIVHRDIKPENFLLHNGSLKLIDFGLATLHDPEVDVPLSELVGTPFYLAPEVLKEQYSGACDMWSVGVMAYILLVGRPPFVGETNSDIMASIRRGHFTFEGVQLSEGAQDFIKSLLKRDPRRRMPANKAMEHPWILQHL